MPTGYSKTPEETRLKRIKALTGRKLPLKTRNKMSEYRKTRINELNPMWKGDDANYFSKHTVIRKRLGTPKFCEHCKNSKLRHRQYQWANISGTYKRDLTDWVRLCVKCHIKYDKSLGRGRTY